RGTCWHAHVGAGNAPDLRNRIERQVDRRMLLPDRLLVRSGHEAERLALFEVHMRGVAERMEFACGAIERIELLEELLFCEHLGRKAAFGLVVGVYEVLHLGISFGLYRVYT